MAGGASSTQEASINASVPDSSTVDRSQSRHQQVKLRKLARQLAALRKLCTREGLVEEVCEAETPFGIAETSLGEWTAVVERVTAKQRRWLDLPALKSRSSGAADGK